MIEDNNLDEMFDQTMARAHNLSLQKQDCLFASLYPTLLSRSEMPHHSLIVCAELYFSLKIGFQSTEQQNHIQIFSPKTIKTKRNLVAMAVRVLIPILFEFVVLCRRSAPLASSIYRVYTLHPVLCTHVGFKKGILAV